MIVAVIDVGFVLRFESRFEISKSCGRVDAHSFVLTVEFITDSALAPDAKVSIEQAEPEDKCVITCEGSKGNTLIGRLKAKHL